MKKPPKLKQTYRYRIFCCVCQPEGRYVTTVEVSGVKEALALGKLASSLPMVEKVYE